MTKIVSTLADEARAELAELSRANLDQSRRYPGDRGDRQPVHTVYGGAHLYRAESARRIGDIALASLEQHAPDAFAFATALRLPAHDMLPTSSAERSALSDEFANDPASLRAERPELWLPLAVHDRVLSKLRREPVEDQRIDFEDGFGVRSDAEEDEAAIRTAREVARAMRENLLPPFIGIRIKALTEETKHRAVRTLDLFVSTLVEEAGRLPDGFVVTLPKITVPQQARTLVRLFEKLERRHGLAAGTIQMEMMIELTQTILDHHGQSNLPRLISACEGRCRGAHFGTYDYTASADITAAWQTMDHPICRFALHVMKNAFAGTGVFLSDGATNVMPTGTDSATVHAAWRLMFGNVRGSLANGYYQGWDLHPAQLPIRYAACHAFFLEGLGATSERLRNFIDKAAKATLVGNVFDDAATGQGLLNYFLRGLSSGAVSLEELAATGLTEDEIRTRSFAKILAGRAAH